MKVRTYKAPNGNVPYARAVLDAMRTQVTRGMRDRTVREIASSLRGSSRMETLSRTWDFLKSRVPYQEDPPGIERIYSAKYTVAQGVPGDCDDQSVAASTVLTLQGIPNKFRVVAWRKPEFSHVLTVAKLEDGTEVPFDLTQNELGQTYNYHTFLDGALMADIQTISDGNATTQNVRILRDTMLRHPSLSVRKQAYYKLEKRYPVELRYWAAKVATDANVTGARRIGDSPAVGDWLGSVLEFAGNIVSSAVGLPAGGSIVKGLVDPSGGGTSTAAAPGPKQADPNRRGRSTTDARTYIEELGGIYEPNQKPQPQQTNDGVNYASVIHVNVLPPLDQNIKADHPGQLFLSWDGKSFWISSLKSVDAEAVGNAYKLTYNFEDGTTQVGPNFYARTIYTDGSERFDNIGKNAGTARPVAQKDAQTDKSTAIRANEGKSALPPSDLPEGAKQSGAAEGPGGTAPSTGTVPGGMPDVVKQGAAMLSGNTGLYVALGLGVALLLSKR